MHSSKIYNYKYRTKCECMYAHVGGENRYFLLKRHGLPVFANFRWRAVLCSMFVSLFCNYFIPFAQYRCNDVLVVSVTVFYSLVYF